MNKPITLCDRCDNAYHCLLNYDGKLCRKNRTVEPTKYDSIISKTPEEFAEWLVAILDHAESDNCGKSCPLYSYCIESNGGILDWLKSPVEVDE